jgi:L-alanine-DL-glutamate epimerase-like enolase superfamily enzyme
MVAMRIQSVRSWLLSYPMDPIVKLSYYGGERTILKRDAMLVRIEAGNGLVGYGPGEASEKAQRSIETVIGPFLEGKELDDPEALRAEFLGQPGVDLTLSKIYAGVELTLYDLLGKQRGLPVSELIGGRVRDRIALYGSAGMYQEPEGYAAEAAGIAELGFHGYKMRPALGPDRDVETVRLMRDAVGPDMDLMIDAHSWWRMGDRSYPQQTIEDLAARMSEFRIAWLEEPLPPDDHDAYRQLRDQKLTPIASGEHEPSEERFLDLIRKQSVDYVQADVVCQGGYAVGRSILAELARAGMRFAFHSWGTDLEAMAAAHLGICWPETVVEWLEYPVYTSGKLTTMYPFPLASNILKEPLRISDGALLVPNEPGLGVSVDESVIERYPWIPGPWSHFTLISPPGTWSVTSDHSIPWADKNLPEDR